MIKQNSAEQENETGGEQKMRQIKKGFIYISMACFLSFSSLTAYGECLVFPPVCPIEMCGYQTQDSPNEQMLQKTVSTYKATKKVVKATRKSLNHIVSMATSLPASISSLALKAMMWPFKKLGDLFGLTEDAVDEDTQGITQDNSHGDISISERITRDLKAYATEPQTAVEVKEFNKKRRQYIRQQATITLMARVLTLKAKLKDIKDVMEETKAQVQKNVSASGGEPNKTTYNESALIKTNYELRQAWFKLLAIQRHIEAVKLEYAANQAMAGMKMIKTVPTIAGNNKNSKTK